MKVKGWEKYLIIYLALCFAWGVLHAFITMPGWALAVVTVTLAGYALFAELARPRT